MTLGRRTPLPRSQRNERAAIVRPIQPFNLGTTHVHPLHPYSLPKESNQATRAWLYYMVLLGIVNTRASGGRWSSSLVKCPIEQCEKGIDRRGLLENV